MRHCLCRSVQLHYEAAEAPRAARHWWASGWMNSLLSVLWSHGYCCKNGRGRDTSFCNSLHSKLTQLHLVITDGINGVDIFYDSSIQHL